MNATLIKGLKMMDETGWHELQLVLQLAALARELQNKFSKDENFMIEKLGLKTKAQYQAFIKGAYPETSLRHIARLQALQIELTMEREASRLKEQFRMVARGNEPSA
jgi:hypothetical protein